MFVLSGVAMSLVYDILFKTKIKLIMYGDGGWVTPFREPLSVLCLIFAVGIVIISDLIRLTENAIERWLNSTCYLYSSCYIPRIWIT